MKKEFYICQVVRWNPILRDKLCSWSGLFNSPDDFGPALAQLQIPEQLAVLANNIGCRVDDVFFHMHHYLSSILCPALRSVRKLGPSDVQLLISDKFITIVSKHLSCPNRRDDVFKALFSKEDLEDILVEANILDPKDSLDIHTLVFRTISGDNPQRIRDSMHAAVDVWTILLTAMKDKAINTLCKSLECEAEDIFPTIVEKCEVQSYANYESERQDDGTQVLDSYAVVKLQEQLRAISMTYFVEAKRIAEKLRQQSAVTHQVDTLLPLIEFYGGAGFRTALLRALRPTMTIGSFVDALEIHVFQAFNPSFLLNAESLGDKRVLIRFKDTKDTTWKNLLTLTSQKQEYCDHISRNLPATADTLDGKGDKLHEKILRSSIPAFSDSARKAWELLMENNPRLTQYFLLSRRHLRDRFGIRAAFRYQEPDVHEIRRDVRTSYKHPQELYEDTVKEYQQIGINPKIV